MVPTLTSAILLVEDEYNLRQSLRLILMHAGYAVKTFKNCKDASDGPEKTEYSLVVLSLHNSGQSASDQIAKIRACYPSVPIMVLAANESTDLERAGERGAEFYLVKPIDPGLILAQINTIIKGHYK
ncbi:MAG: response regulator [Anaerolineaceae bacterium]|nr:response regulator [Anaerolineaceae bacterium]